MAVHGRSVTDLVRDVSTVVLADVAHERRRLARLLQARELDALLRVNGARRRLARLLRDQHALVTRQRTRVVRRLGAVDAQVRAACDTVERRHVIVVLVTRDAQLNQ